MTRILVTGGSGVVGSHLVSRWKDRFEVVAGYYQHPLPAIQGVTPVQLDLSNPSDVKSRIDGLQVDAIVHCAALIDHAACEENPSLAERINVHGTEAIARSALQRRLRLVYVSTNSVFDGARGQYREDDEAAPRHVYGQTKKRAEERVLQAGGLVLRTVPYGFHRYLPIQGRRPNILEWAFHALASEERVLGYVDSWLNPVSAADMAMVIEECLEADLRGLYHVASRRMISKYEFVREVARVFHLNGDRLYPVETPGGPQRLTLDGSKLLNSLPHVSVREVPDGLLSIAEEGPIRFPDTA